LSASAVPQTWTHLHFLATIPAPIASSHIRWLTNLTHNQRKALVELRENHDIMVLPADKGSTTVVLDKAYYLQEAYRQLTDPNSYMRTTTDLTYTHKQKISDSLPLMVLVITYLKCP